MNLIQKINNKTILLSPLDWGFGHTTRCVSIISNLLLNNNKIVFAGNDAQINFISKEFPSIKTEFICGYNIYLSSEKSTYNQIAKQTIKIVKAIKHENRWVKDYVTKHNIDLIISDNRYGFRYSEIESIFIGHQLNLELPHFKTTVNKKLAKYINQFDECWIPDNEQFNLSGSLSKTDLLSIPFKHIGLLSRFSRLETPIIYDYLFIISGPSPENELFLKKVEKQIGKTTLRITIVSSEKSNAPLVTANYFFQPSTDVLNQLINQSDCIVSKAGYTTIMELVSLNKKGFLIPTQGQFEQEYLANHIKHEKLNFIKSINLLDI